MSIMAQTLQDNLQFQTTQAELCHWSFTESYISNSLGDLSVP